MEAERHRVLIVDDEQPGRVNLRCALAAHPGWEVAGECASAAEARALLAAGPVDLVLLDIQMPRESGLAFARELCGQAEPPLIVFVTAHQAHALEAFELHALDYLLKPVRSQRLAAALERAAHMLALRQRAPYGQAVRSWLQAKDDGEAGRQVFLQQLTVRSVGKIEWVRIDEVLWIGAAGNYAELHLAGRSVLHRATLATLEKALDPQVFLRVHRSAIVRAGQVAALEVAGDGSYLLRLRCGAAIGVSERYVDAVRARCTGCLPGL